MRCEADGMQPNTLTMHTALVGVVIGTAGFVISLLNYFRDRPKVIVILGWNYVSTDEDDLEKTWSVVTVTNVGRRPIFVSHAHLTYPNTTAISQKSSGWRIILRMILSTKAFNQTTGPCARVGVSRVFRNPNTMGDGTPIRGQASVLCRASNVHDKLRSSQAPTL